MERGIIQPVAIRADQVESILQGEGSSGRDSRKDGRREGGKERIGKGRAERISVKTCW